jgi:predicted HTH transcriptional regulator
MSFSIEEIKEIISTGESSIVQFKEKFNSADALASEICAFANTKGGKIIVGVKDTGDIRGLTPLEISKLNQMISNCCSQKIYPTISVETENIKVDNRVLIVIHVPLGPNKFYMANGRDVWVKVGADKRRAGKEEMRRLLQESFNIFADEQPIQGTNMNDLDPWMLKAFLEKKTGNEKEEITEEDEKSLENMKILNDGRCTLAGLLLLGKRSYPLFSQYQISAVSWYGNDPGVKDYRESEDIKGNVLILYEDALAFIKRQLRKLQMGQHVNSIGKLEIPSIALEEALINAIVHRNYYIQSNIRIFVFDNRVEIINPGTLPNTLTVESIKSGVHISRNPILLSHIKDIEGIPYRGTGMGVKRIIKACEEYEIPVEFENQIENNQFKVTFWRN